MHDPLPPTNPHRAVKHPHKALLQGDVEIGHRHRQPQIDKAGHAAPCTPQGTMPSK